MRAFNDDSNTPKTKIKHKIKTRRDILVLMQGTYITLSDCHCIYILLNCQQKKLYILKSRTWKEIYK